MKKEIIFSMVAAAAFILIASAFSWYELRPRNIKAECSELAIIKARSKIENGPLKEWESMYDFLYKKCLRDSGL